MRIPINPINYYDDIEEEINIIDKIDDIGDILINLGVSKIVARTLTYLRNVDTATSIELQKGTGLSQPEISLAMRELKPLDWVDESEEKKPDRGRPNNVYSLKVEFKDIITNLETKKKKELEDAMAACERLKKMAKMAQEKARKNRIAQLQEMIESMKNNP
jgi:predicted transcriptional regulator